MSTYDTPEKMEKRRQEIAGEIIRGGKVRYGGARWLRLVALLGLSPSDMDWEPGADDGEPDYSR